MMEFGIKIYGYDPLLSKEEIENFGAKALSFSFSTNLFFQTLGKFNHQTFKKGLIQTNAFRKSLTKNASQLRGKKVY